MGCIGADFAAVEDPAIGVVERRIHTAKGAHVLFVPPDRRVICVTNRVDGSVVMKVPEVALTFWIMKIAATTLGETGGDTLTMTLGWGYLAATCLFLGLGAGLFNAVFDRLF